MSKDPKSLAIAILSKKPLVGMKKKDEPMDEEETSEMADDAPLTAAVEDLFAAVAKKDVAAGKDALRTAFMFLDAQPHEEGEHEEEDEEV